MPIEHGGLGDDNVPAEDDHIDAEGEAPIETTNEVVEDGQGGTEAPPEPKYLDLSTVGDHLVRLKVGGEEVELPASELEGGWMRHADYTRKTQEAAALRQQAEEGLAILQALEADPQLALQILQARYAQEATPDGALVESGDDDWLQDPVERELHELRAQTQRFQEHLDRQHLEATLGQLQAKYGDDFVPHEVVQQAVAWGVRDINQLESVYKQMAFDRILTRSEAEKQAAAQAAAEEAKRQAAAQQAQQLVTAGASGAGATTEAPPVPQTIREAWELSKRQLGLS